MRRCVVDCETLGTGQNPVILAIGAAIVDDDDLAPAKDSQPTLYHSVSIDSCLRNGLTATASTLMWWLEQSDEARMAIVEGQRYGDVTLLAEALGLLTRFYNTNNCEEIWSYGATADITWLESAYAAMGLTPPWTYWQCRCLRTLGAHKDPDGALRPEPAVKHHALEDALAEAVWLSRLLQ